ncbi:MAG: LLM class flavin-dependent oxidoreductase [Solirubrobacterales bacterium]
MSKPPLRFGVMQLTMEPLEEILGHAQQLDANGFDTIWLAEAYPWWRKHQMEARSSTALSALIGRETDKLTIGWGIISPYTRHPLTVAMEARVSQETAGEGRFRLGFGASKILMKAIGEGEGERKARPLTAIKESIEIIQKVESGEAFEFAGKEFSASVPDLSAEAEAPRWKIPMYVAGTGPKMQQLAGEIGDGLLTASITTPDFVTYSRENMAIGAAKADRDPDEIDLGCTLVASIDEDRDKGRQGAREIAGMYLANKVQNIRGSADVLLEKANLTMDDIVPIAEAMERGGRLAAADAVSDEILDKCVPIAGTPEECVAAVERYRDAGCTHVMLELWGEERDRQIELFGTEVLPRFR